MRLYLQVILKNYLKPWAFPFDIEKLYFAYLVEKNLYTDLQLLL